MFAESPPIDHSSQYFDSFWHCEHRNPPGARWSNIHWFRTSFLRLLSFRFQVTPRSRRGTESVGKVILSRSVGSHLLAMIQLSRTILAVIIRRHQRLIKRLCDGTRRTEHCDTSGSSTLRTSKLGSLHARTLQPPDLMDSQLLSRGGQRKHSTPHLFLLMFHELWQLTVKIQPVGSDMDAYFSREMC